MLNDKEIILGSRNSLLAKTQTMLVIERLKKFGFKKLKTKFIKSSGDILRGNSFKDQGGKGLFTKEIDSLTVNGEIDLGIHSAKDIPAFLHKSLVIGAYLKREDVRDILITRDHDIKKINHLPSNCSIGSSSPRRTCYVNYYRPDIKVIPIRGNIDSRIKKLESKEVDALIIALAGINRLTNDYSNLSLSPIPISQILPSPGQGAIAITYKKDNKECEEICKIINDKATAYALLAERSLIKQINGNCFTPIAALAEINQERLVLQAKLFSEDGRIFSDKKLEGITSNAKKIGSTCADYLINNLINREKNEK